MVFFTFPFHLFTCSQFPFVSVPTPTFKSYSHSHLYSDAYIHESLFTVWWQHSNKNSKRATQLSLPTEPRLEQFPYWRRKPEVIPDDGRRSAAETHVGRDIYHTIAVIITIITDVWKILESACMNSWSPRAQRIYFALFVAHSRKYMRGLWSENIVTSVAKTKFLNFRKCVK